MMSLPVASGGGGANLGVAGDASPVVTGAPGGSVHGGAAGTTGGSPAGLREPQAVPQFPRGAGRGWGVYSLWVSVWLQGSVTAGGQGVRHPPEHPGTCGYNRPQFPHLILHRTPPSVPIEVPSCPQHTAVGGGLGAAAPWGCGGFIFPITAVTPSWGNWGGDGGVSTDCAPGGLNTIGMKK